MLNLTVVPNEVLGPRPAHDPAAGMSAARAAVLDQLTVEGGPRLVAQLASASGQHPNTVREHLEALVEAGLVVRRPGTPSGRGRPAHQYQTLPVEQTRPAVREYAGLASALASQIARSSPDPRGDALAAGVAWGRELAGAAGAEAASPGRRTAPHARRRVVEVMEDLGFAPEPDGRAAVVRLRRCPLLETARAHREVVCGVHLGMVRGALEVFGGEDQRTALTPFAEPGACLLHLLIPRQSALTPRPPALTPRPPARAVAGARRGR